MVVVAIPPPYRGPTAGADRIEVPAGTVRQCIDAVEARFPGFRTQILDDRGRVHSFVKLFVNGDQLGADALEIAVGDGDRLEVLAAIAGG